MHVGVEKPIAHGVPQKRAQERQAQLVEVEPRRFELGMVGDRNAIHPLRGQHPFGGAAPIDRRHPEAAIGKALIAFDVVGHLGHGGRF